MIFLLIEQGPTGATCTSNLFPHPTRIRSGGKAVARFEHLGDGGQHLGEGVLRRAGHARQRGGEEQHEEGRARPGIDGDRKRPRLNSSHYCASSLRPSASKKKNQRMKTTKSFITGEQRRQSIAHQY